jgi:hypothetical protein
MADRYLSDKEYAQNLGGTGVTYKNYLDFLDSSDRKKRLTARNIAKAIEIGQMDPTTGAGKPMAPTRQQAADTRSAEEQWATFYEQQAANLRNPGNPPHPELKPPTVPEPSRRNTTYESSPESEAALTTQRYAAQVPKGAKGTTKTVTTEAGKTTVTGTSSTGTKPKPKPATATGTGTGTGGTGTGGTGKPVKKPGISEKDAIAYASAEFFIPEAIIKGDQQLYGLVQEYVAGKITPDLFKTRLQGSTYVAKNSQIIRKRKLQAAQYQELIDGGQDVSNTPMGMEIRDLMDRLRSQAKATGATLNDTELQKIAVKLWSSGQENSDYAVSVAIRPFITATKDPETGLSTATGQAASTERAVLQTLAANGFEPQMLSSVFNDLISAAVAEGADSADAVNSAILSKIMQDVADGGNVDDYLQKIRSAAGYGYNDNIKKLLAQGVNLDAIAQPYIGAMAGALEINPATINMNDPTIRMALSGDKELNLFDFARQLRRDDRWQYTKQARDEAYGATLNILRDFGFTG